MVCHIRTRSTVGQKLPDDWEEKVEEFNSFLPRNADLSHVFNMNEVPDSFDALLSQMANKSGVTTIPISTTVGTKG